MLPPDEAVRTLTAEWDKAEALMKLAERIRAEVVQPSVNELRYAGRRLVDAWKLAESAKAGNADALKSLNEFVSDAIFRCHCAQHDAIDASVLFVQRVLGEYEAEFGHVLLLRHLPDVADLRAALAEADQQIVISRGDRGKRAAEYDRLARDHLPTIVTIYRKITSNREALEAMVAATQTEEKTGQTQFHVNIWVTIACTFVGVILGALLT